MRVWLIFLSITLLASACLDWSTEQKSVLAVYDALTDCAQRHDWSSFSDYLSSGSVRFLDETCSLYTLAGIPFDNNRENLIRGIASATDVFVFPSSVVSVETRSGQAFLLAGAEENRRTYTFVRENNCWKLDITADLTAFLNRTMKGIPKLSPNEEPLSGVTVGSGSCELVIENRLENLSLWYAYCQPDGTDSLGEDLLGTNILCSGQRLTLWLDPGTYDILLLTPDSSEYALIDLNLDAQGTFRTIGPDNMSGTLSP